VTTTQVTTAHGEDVSASGTSGIGDQSGGPSTVEWVPVEPWPGPPPVPVLAPYLGLVAAVLCAMGGGWLLLAPYALDFRHGAARVPRAAAVDLETGAAIVAVGIVTAALFSLALVRRLRANPSAEAEALIDPVLEPQSAPEPEPETPRPSITPPQADPGGALRELLTPLVAALAADLRSHDQERGTQEHRVHEHGAQQFRDEHRRQEP
jgi:hypothetical protein